MDIILSFRLACFLKWNHMLMFRVSREKSDKEIMREIQAIMRQIASSITYLPCLEEPCKILETGSYMILVIGILWMNLYIKWFGWCSTVGVFDVLAYTDKDLAVPFTWVESDPKLISNPQMVKLHSFDTKVKVLLHSYFGGRDVGKQSDGTELCLGLQIHKVDTLVSYKNDEWDEA